MQARQTFRTIDRMARRRVLYVATSRPPAPPPPDATYAPPLRALTGYASPGYLAGLYPPAAVEAVYVAPVPAPNAPPAYLAELEHLAHLHADGVLTTEEYEAKKRQVLGI